MTPGIYNVAEVCLELLYLSSTRTIGKYNMLEGLLESEFEGSSRGAWLLYTLDLRLMVLFHQPNLELWKGLEWNREGEGDARLANQISQINPGDQEMSQPDHSHVSCVRFKGNPVSPNSKRQSWTVGGLLGVS